MPNKVMSPTGRGYGVGLARGARRLQWGFLIVVIPATASGFLQPYMGRGSDRSPAISGFGQGTTNICVRQQGTITLLEAQIVVDKAPGVWIKVPKY